MTDPRCGTTAGYNVHRRRKTPPCQPCKTAQADWQRHYKARVYLARTRLIVDATGTHRRLKALARMGWSLGVLGERVGLHKTALVKVLENDRVYLSTAQKVARLYDELWDKPGGSNHAMSRARAKGWLPPLAWDDEDLDLPAARPVTDVPRYPDEPNRHRDMEREAKVIELTRAGLSAAEIAVRLGTYKRYVTRVRSRAREEGAA